MSSEPNSTKSNLRFIFLTVFVYSVGFGIIMPALPALIVELEGVSLSRATQLGAYIGAAYAVAQFLMGPVVGNLSDRFGRRPIFLISLTGFGIDFLLMGFAQSIVWLFIGRAIAGGLGAIFGPANASIADMFRAEDRAKYFSYTSAAFGIGMIAGPTLGGVLAGIDLRLPFFVAGTLPLFIGVYGFWGFKETLAKEKRRPLQLKRANPLSALKNLSRESGLLPLILAYFVWLCTINIYPVSWSYYSRVAFSWDSELVGISMTIVGLSMASAQILLIGRLITAIGERRTAMVGISTALTLFALLVIGIPGVAALVLGAFMGLLGLVIPSITTMMSRKVSASHQGELQGLTGSLSALGALIAQLSYNSLLSYYTSETTPVHFPGAPFLLAIIFGLISLSILYYQKPMAQS